MIKKKKKSNKTTKKILKENCHCTSQLTTKTNDWDLKLSTKGTSRTRETIIKQKRLTDIFYKYYQCYQWG